MTPTKNTNSLTNKLTRRGLFGILAGAFAAPVLPIPRWKVKAPFEITKTTIVPVAARKLKATWTLELAQDLKALHSIEAEQQLSSILSKEILDEIDKANNHLTA